MGLAEEVGLWVGDGDEPLRKCLMGLPTPRRAHLISTHNPNCESNEAANCVTHEVTSYNLNYVN